MAVARSLHRLLEVLRVQEEQARSAAVEAAAHRKRLLAARCKAAARERKGRLLVAESVRSGAVADRAAGLEEIQIGRREAAVLALRLERAEREEEMRRQEFLARRTDRRQAETLLAAAERNQKHLESCRAQQLADDLHLNRMRAHPREEGAAAARPGSSRSDPSRSS